MSIHFSDKVAKAFMDIVYDKTIPADADGMKQRIWKLTTLWLTEHHGENGLARANHESFERLSKSLGLSVAVERTIVPAVGREVADHIVSLAAMASLYTPPAPEEEDDERMEEPTAESELLDNDEDAGTQ